MERAEENFNNQPPGGDSTIPELTIVERDASEEAFFNMEFGKELDAGALLLTAGDRTHGPVDIVMDILQSAGAIYSSDEIASVRKYFHELQSRADLSGAEQMRLAALRAEKEQAEAKANAVRQKLQQASGFYEETYVTDSVKRTANTSLFIDEVYDPSEPYAETSGILETIQKMRKKSDSEVVKTKLVEADRIVRILILDEAGAIE